MAAASSATCRRMTRATELMGIELMERAATIVGREKLRWPMRQSMVCTGAVGGREIKSLP